MTKQDIFLGNGAIALGLLEGGCQVVASYPGTPSSEILPEVTRMVRSEGLNTYVEWSTNEKVALDTAFAASITGKRAACCMKQVGLNVAADSLMSAAYLGTVGGLVIISCDDPGPHSSQTEQDTRFMARIAKVPVFDPSTPQEAREMAVSALDLSEEFRVPVILRPAIRVCHARQGLEYEDLKKNNKKANFAKDPSRWAATPNFRLKLHGELNHKLEEIGKKFATLSKYNFHNLEQGVHYPLGIIAGGVPYAVIRDILREEERTDIPLLKLGTPYPFPKTLADAFLAEEAADIKAGWAANGARYEAMADATLIGQLDGVELGWMASGARYQAMADAFLASQSAGLKAGWDATAARYQALADYYLSK